MKQLEDKNLIVKDRSKNIIYINYEFINSVILDNASTYRMNYNNILEYNNGTFEIVLIKKRDISHDEMLDDKHKLLLYKLIEQVGKKVHFDLDDEKLLNDLEEEGYIFFDGDLQKLYISFE